MLFLIALTIMSIARMNTQQVIGFQLIEHDFGNVT